MADRPAHMLEIPDSLGRDVDKARAGKLKAELPVEAFMSQAALDQVAKQTADAKAAVHAEQLVPISHAEARARRTQHGETLPDMPATRRVIPAPFRRPRIEAGQHGKTWAYIPASQVAAGDIIPGVGRVAEVREEAVYARREHVLAGLAHSYPVLLPPLGVYPVGTNREDLVPVAPVVVVTGIDGVVKAYRETDQVHVFRKHDTMP